jgi:hypothetical protein
MSYEVKQGVDHEYILVASDGREINGGDGLRNKVALEIQASMINEETAPLLERIAKLEAAFTKIADEIEHHEENNYRLDAQFGEFVRQTVTDALKKAGGNG